MSSTEYIDAGETLHSMPSPSLAPDQATVTVHVGGNKFRVGHTYKELSRMTQLDFATETTDVLMEKISVVPKTYWIVLDADGDKVDREFTLLEEETSKERVKSLLNTYLLKMIDEYREVGY